MNIWFHLLSIDTRKCKWQKRNRKKCFFFPGSAVSWWCYGVPAEQYTTQLAGGTICPSDCRETRGRFDGGAGRNAKVDFLQHVLISLQAKVVITVDGPFALLEWNSLQVFFPFEHLIWKKMYCWPLPWQNVYIFALLLTREKITILHYNYMNVPFLVFNTIFIDPEILK